MGPSGFCLGELCDGGAFDRAGGAGGHSRGSLAGAVLQCQQLHWWKLRNEIKN